MITNIEGLASEVLKHGQDDWVYLAEVECMIRTHRQGELPGSVKSQCFAVVAHLLANKLMEVGDLMNVNGDVRFISWSKDTHASLEEMERRWSRFGGSLDENGANDVCWLSNTEAGDAWASVEQAPCSS